MFFRGDTSLAGWVEEFSGAKYSQGCYGGRGKHWLAVSWQVCIIFPPLQWTGVGINQGGWGRVGFEGKG